ncbi:MAG: hypothetical protein WCI17_07915, partial [bacterium]
LLRPARRPQSGISLWSLFLSVLSVSFHLLLLFMRQGIFRLSRPIGRVVGERVMVVAVAVLTRLSGIDIRADLNRYEHNKRGFHDKRENRGGFVGDGGAGGVCRCGRLAAVARAGP